MTELSHEAAANDKLMRRMAKNKPLCKFCRQVVDPYRGFCSSRRPGQRPDFWHHWCDPNFVDTGRGYGVIMQGEAEASDASDWNLPAGDRLTEWSKATAHLFKGKAP